MMNHHEPVSGPFKSNANSHVFIHHPLLEDLEKERSKKDTSHKALVPVQMSENKRKWYEKPHVFKWAIGGAFLGMLLGGASGWLLTVPYGLSGPTQTLSALETLAYVASGALMMGLFFAIVAAMASVRKTPDFLKPLAH